MCRERFFLRFMGQAGRGRTCGDKQIIGVSRRKIMARMQGAGDVQLACVTLACHKGCGQQGVQRAAQIKPKVRAKACDGCNTRRRVGVKAQGQKPL